MHACVFLSLSLSLSIVSFRFLFVFFFLFFFFSLSLSLSLSFSFRRSQVKNCGPVTLMCLTCRGVWSLISKRWMTWSCHLSVAPDEPVPEFPLDDDMLVQRFHSGVFGGHLNLEIFRDCQYFLEHLDHDNHGVDRVMILSCLPYWLDVPFATIVVSSKCLRPRPLINHVTWNPHYVVCQLFVLVMKGSAFLNMVTPRNYGVRQDLGFNLLVCPDWGRWECGIFGEAKSVTLDRDPYFTGVCLGCLSGVTP